MIDIQTALYNLMHARYGQQVRQSLHDAVYQINENANEALQTAKAMGVGTAVTSASSSSTGYVAGNLYLNNSTWDLWQCIGTNSWLNCGNVKGAQGNRGTDGTSYYVYIRYSPNYDGTDFTASPTASSQYVGFYSGTSATAPTNKQDYAWTSYVGASGTSAYVHIMYSENADGSNFVSTPTANTKYIGFYSGTASSAPANKSLYTWSEYVGRSGTGTGDMLKSEFAGSGVVGAVDRALTADSATDSTNASNLKKSDNTTVSADDITAKLSRVDDSADWLKSKNLFNENALIYGGINTSTGEITGSMNTRLVSPEYIPITPNINYVFSAKTTTGYSAKFLYCFYNSAKTFLGASSGWLNNNGLINISDSSAKYIRCLLADTNNSELPSLTSIYDVQIEEGTTATSYQPYNKSNTEITETLSTYSNPNLLDNPFFTFNSKGLTTYTGAIECVDKWLSWESGNTTTVNTNGTVSVSKQIAQKLNDNGKGIKGKTVTLSIMLENGEVKHITTNIGSNLTSSVIVSLTVATDVYCILYADAVGGISTQLNNLSSSAITIKAIKLEYGNISTLANDNPNVEGYTPYTITNELPRWEQEKTVSGVGEQTVIFTVDTSRAYELWFNTPYGSQCSIVSSTLSGTTLTYVVNIPSNEAGTKVRLRSSI